MTDIKWKLVPVEPTEEMMAAGFGNLIDLEDNWGHAPGMFRAMLKTSPTYEITDEELTSIAEAALERPMNPGDLLCVERAMIEEFIERLSR